MPCPPLHLSTATLAWARVLEDKQELPPVGVLPDSEALCSASSRSGLRASDSSKFIKTENPSAPDTMLMMEGPSHFDSEREYNWAGTAAADEELGEDSFMWLNDAMENSLMGLNIQTAPQQPVAEAVAPNAAVPAAVSAAPVASSIAMQSPALAPPAMQVRPTPEQAPPADDAWANEAAAPAIPSSKPLPSAPVPQAPMALQTPQRLSTSSSHRSSTSSSSSSSSRKPRKLRPCPNNLTSPSPSTSLPGDDSAGKRSPSARIDVRFIPQDPAIAELVRLAGYCPKLELKTPSTKRVGFFLQHLSKKWASVSVIGKLQLFLAPSSSSLRSSPDGKVPANGPPLSADVSLDTLAPHFDIQASKARPILFLCYSLPVDPTPRLREGSSWACEDLSNLLCGEPQVNLNEPEPLVPLQPQAYTLSPEDASLLRGLPDVSFSLPEGSTNTHNPATPAPPSFCWRSELGSLRASASHSSSDCDSCKTGDMPTASPKKRPLYSGNQGVEMPTEGSYYQPSTSCAPLAQEQSSYSNGQQASEPAKAPGSDKKKRRIAPVLVSATVPALAQEPCKENVQYMG